MENIIFNEQNYIFEKQRPKKTHGLHTQLGFQGHEKGKFSALKTKVCNESHII